MKNFPLRFASAAFFCFVANFTLAAEQTYLREYKYQASEADSKITARAIALQQVKQILLGELGTHVSALVKQNTSSDGRILGSVQIETLSAGIVSVKILEEHWNGVSYLLKAQIKADPAEVLNAINRMLDAEGKQAQIKQLGGDLALSQAATFKTSEELARTRKENTAGLAEIERLKGELAKQQSEAERNKLQTQYQKQAQQLTQNEVFDEAVRHYNAKNFKASFTLFKKLAEQGDAAAQYNLGVMYNNGEGVTRDTKQAVYWWTKAAEQGDASGQYNLGQTYYKGEGVTRNLKQAVYWYTKAAEQGDAAAQFNLGSSYDNGEGVTRDPKQAVYWWTKAAEQGYAAAQFNLGNSYANGEGVTRDPKQAVYWYTKAAEQGKSAAQYNLGLMYNNGEGVTRDPKQAVVWYIKAAEQGYAAAQYSLGLRYYKGEGVTRDPKQAVYWWTKAADQGEENAAKALQILGK